MWGQLPEQSPLADDADDCALWIENRQVPEVALAHAVEGAGDGCLGANSMHWMLHGLCQRNVAGCREIMQQARHVAFSQDAKRFAVSGDHEIVSRTVNQAGDGLGQRRIRRQGWNFAINDAIQRAQMAKCPAANVKAKICFTDDAQRVACAINNDEMLDSVSLEQIASRSVFIKM